MKFAPDKSFLRFIDQNATYEHTEAMTFRKKAMETYLLELKEKKEFDTGDIVTTIVGPLANICLMVVGKEEGVVKIAPAPGMPVQEMLEDQLFHFEDFQRAFEAALEQYPYSPKELSL